MQSPRGWDVIKDWPDESQEAAQLVFDAYGEPHEATESFLVWQSVGPWKRVIESGPSSSTSSRHPTLTRSSR